MSSKIMVNISEPAPEADIVIPDTGTLSMSDGVNSFSNDVAPIVGVVALLLLAMAAIIAVIIRCRNKKRIGFGKHESFSSVSGLHLKKSWAPRIACMTLIFLVSAFAVFNSGISQGAVNAEGLEEENPILNGGTIKTGDSVDGEELSISTEDVAIEVEMGDEPVFGVGSTTVTIDSATTNGYTLVAYIDSNTTDLISEDSDMAIEMLETVGAQALTENTWGIALEEPTSWDSSIFRGLPTTEKEAMIVKVSGTKPTPVDDETTLYYSAYVTPDLDYGVYTGATVNYIAVAHVVTTDDVTVRYHGNGFYFDEEKTQDTNTVVYGETCKLSYIDVRGGCSTVYVGEDSKISKSPNVNDDGSAEHGYDDYLDGSTYIDSVSFSGADMLKVYLIYGLETDYDYLYVFEGDDITTENWRNNNAVTVLNEYGKDDDDYEYLPAGETTLFIGGDSVSFVLLSDLADDYYGYYAVISPVYLNKPDGIQTKEDRICNFVKSDNVNEDGGKEESYYPETEFLQTVSIPGANKIKVEISYAITDGGAEIDIVKGVWNGEYSDYYDENVLLSAYEDNVYQADSLEFIVDDGAITFKMESWGEPVDGYDYGFYARLYPIYDEEHEGTIPVQDCSFAIKAGSYKRVMAQEDYNGWWYLYVEIDGDYYGERWYFNPIDDTEIMDYIKGNIDFYAGRTVDVYAASFYEIIYDGNGGVLAGGPDDEWANRQWVWEFVTSSIWNNMYLFDDDYFFAGWNTKPDGSGAWYYPGDSISSEGHLGETLTLYAQWSHK
ncbi:hypothetical protein IKT18_02015 [Candidatus Saccharibacteria bacterium]|nr:hypothetical protein [Candidatus Saccharibacteria bacterium]